MKVLSSFSKSIFIRLLVLQACFAIALVAPAFAEVSGMTRLSVNPSTGIQGNDHSTFSQIGKSSGGTYSVFHSNANNLVTTDANGNTDVFLANATTQNKVELISVSTAGVQGDNNSMFPTISDDSNFIAFHSKAKNLIAGQTQSGTSHIYLRDRLAKTTVRISINTQGSRTYANNQFPSISGDGRYIAYQAYAYDTGTGSGNDRVEILVYDRINQTTTLVSRPLTGSQANADSSLPRISNDGKFVAFYSGASNLVSGDTNGEADVFLASTTNAVPVERISVSTAGVQGNGRSYVDGDFSNGINGEANASPKESNALAPGISEDARYVVFPSFSTNLTSGDTNGRADIFLRDRTSGTTTLISKKSDGTGSNGNSFMPAISPDGKYISFTSLGNLVAEDTNGQQSDVYVYEAGAAAGKKLRLISLATTGVAGNKHSLAGSFNSNNKYISFHSVADNLVNGDTNNDSDVFVTINDMCQGDPEKTESGICGCGQVDVDANSDGICDPVVSTYTISGTVKTSGGTGISGVLVTYTGGGATTTVTTGAAGTYSFASRPSGESYTVTPTKSGYTFSPVFSSGTLTANVTRNFTGTVTVVDNCPSDPNKTEPGLCGCGVVDVDVNADGICDIGQKFTISGTVKTSGGTGISGVVVNYVAGGATTSVTTTSSGAFSFANRSVGENYTVTPTKSGYTFSPTTSTGTVTANNTIAFVGTLQTYAVSGTVKTSGGTGISGVEVTYSGGGEFLTFTTSSSGAFNFPNRPYGETYTVILSHSNYTFSPTLSSGTVTGNVSIPFIGTPKTYTISGAITSSGVGVSGVTVAYSTGGTTITATTSASGTYSFPNRSSGESYTVTPSKTGYTFSPTSSSGTVTGNATKNFFASLLSIQIGGIVKTSGGFGISGVVLTYATGGTNYTTTTPSNGGFSFQRFYGETYTLVPTKAGYTFTPASYSGTLTQSTSAVFTGIPDVIDQCPNDPSKTEPGLCGCGFADVDADQDFVCDSNGDDQCPNDFNKTVPGTCGCGNYESDVNNDGICDANQTFTVSGTVKDVSGNPLVGSVVNLYTHDIYVTPYGTPDFTTTTNASGFYSFSGRHPGDTLRLIATYPNYILPTDGNVVFVVGNMTVNFVGNQGDLCPNDPDKTYPGFCGCGRPESDVDNNGVCDFDQLYNVIGKAITPAGAGISGVNFTYVAGAYTKTVTSGPNGAYTFGNRPYGDNFTITPSLTGYTFNPVNYSGTVTGPATKDFIGSQTIVDNCPSDPNKTDPGLCGCGNVDIDVNSDNICDTNQAFTISGKIRDAVSGAPISGIQVGLVINGSQTFSATTNVSGDYLFTGRKPGENYTLTPVKTGYIISPLTKTGQVMADVVAHFVGTLQTFTISGTVKNSGNAGISNVVVEYVGSSGTESVTTNPSGVFTFGLRPYGETYTITPSRGWFTFSPTAASGTVTADATKNFIGTAQTFSLSGTVKTSAGVGISGVVMEYLAGGVIHRIWTDGSGAFNYTGKVGGENYILTANLNGYTFSPVSYTGTMTASIVRNFVGTATVVDNCPSDPLKTEPGICGCGYVDVDVDSDGVCDAPTGSDFCPNDPLKTAPGICGCGKVDVDADSDGVCDAPTGSDLCPNDPLKTAPGLCGCGKVDVDVDGDGVCDAPTGTDFCPNDPLKTAPGICGCGKVDVDADSDGVCDAPTGSDLCPNDPAKTNPGVCGCGTADVDSDNDGIFDCDEVECVGTCDVNDPNFDEDGDGVSNCQEIEDATDACDDGSFKERLKPTACAGVNGFLAQANIATVVNQLSTPLRFDVQYRNQFGQLAGQVNFSLSAYQKRDLIINSMGLEPDTYGTVCVETNAEVDGAWSGGITIYKPHMNGSALDDFGDNTVFDYALSIPFSNPIERGIRMPLNTNNVGNLGTAETVSNWVQITDAVVADGEPLRGRLVFYDIDGKIVQDKSVKLEDGGRYDYPGHVAIGRGRLGAVEFIPKSKEDKFYFVLIRYYPENKMNFLSAFVMPIVFPSGAERNGRLSTLSDEVSVIEVINATSEEVRATKSAFGTTGQAIFTDRKTKIAAKGSDHTIINSSVLGLNTIGSAAVSGPRESITETTIVYRLNDSGALDLAYSLPFVQSAGEVQFADFNSFIGHMNYVEVTNTADVKADSAVVNVVDTSGNLIESIDVSLDPNQAKRFELDIPSDKVGTIMLDSGDDTGLVLRSFVEKEGQYVIPQTGR